MSFKKSSELEKLFGSLDWDTITLLYDELDFANIPWNNCTTGYDNDGSTGLEIWENGFNFAKEVGNSQIVMAEKDNIAYFFAAPESKIIEILNSIIEEGR